LQIKAITLADEIDAYNDDLIMTIIEVIAEKHYPDRKSSDFIERFI